MEMTDVTKLRALNEKRIRALIEKNWDILGELLSPELIFIHSSGRLEGKVGYLQSLMEGKLQYVSMDMPEPQIAVLDDTIAVVRGEVNTEIVSKGQTRSLRSYVHMTWDRHGHHGWCLLSYSGTPLA